MFWNYNDNTELVKNIYADLHVYMDYQRRDIMKKSILKSSIALAVAGVFGATVAVTAAEQATPVPVTQEVVQLLQLLSQNLLRIK